MNGDGGIRVTGERTTRGAVRVDRSTSRDDRSIGDLFKELQGESGSLLRQEVELAKSEVAESARSYAQSSVRIAIGGAFLLAALLGALFAINMGLTALLAGPVGLETAAWLSPLILAGILAIVGMVLVNGGMERIRRAPLVPRQTTATLKEEKQWLKHKIS